MARPHMHYQRLFEISLASNVRSFQAALHGFAADMGFGLVGALLRNHTDKTFAMLNNAPRAYAELSVKPEDALRDPVLSQLRSVTAPFSYDQRFYVDAGAADLWEEQATFGYRTGIVVSLTLVGEKQFSLGFDRVEPLPKCPIRMTRMLADLQLLAVHAQDAAAVLMATPKKFALAAASHEISSPKEKGSILTRRELEALGWTMEGKTAWEAGRLMAVSERTVIAHLGRACKKLDSVNKVQAVVKAIRLGLLN